ncbi:MAG: hypothetical protein UZ05_CHB002003045 [Chlorobi bacterium OLB5]|nr:MAG: hypothetical protein UZ05_CHB002003045 [Chlorobi bacterium OLB5]
MKKDDSVYVENMLLYILQLEKFVSEKSYDDFLGKAEIQSHVIRLLEIIGEASTKVSKDLKDKYPEVIWAKLKGMRNILVHDYGNIKLNVVWNTAISGIDPLKKQVIQILKENYPQILNNYDI